MWINIFSGETIRFRFLFNAGCMILSAGNLTENSDRDIYGVSGCDFVHLLRAALGDRLNFRKIHYPFSNNFLPQLKMYVQKNRGLAGGIRDYLSAKTETIGAKALLISRYRSGIGGFWFVNSESKTSKMKENEHIRMQRNAHIVRVGLFKAWSLDTGDRR